SLAAIARALQQLGKDVVMYLAGAVPLPREYGFMPLAELVRELPDDLEQRVVVAVDCANESRLGREPEVLLDRARLVIDIDHHHDNTRFGDINLVVADASSTGEILWDVLRELGVRITPEIAEALYIAVVTDTGRFQYPNTTARALRLAAELVEAGADVHRVFQGVYENVAFGKLKLVARALEHAKVLEDGRIVIAYLDKEDFEAAGVEEPFSEGIIDYLRAVEGAELAALIREPPTPGGPSRRVSLRTTEEGLDVSAIARKSGGGGHKQAAGFPSEASVGEITHFLQREFRAQSDEEGAVDSRPSDDSRPGEKSKPTPASGSGSD
ncbi:MAG: bifunctional oligoribonuclease/PAP phosphatase NrnA, partial [Actinobacteria bacterium]|nr:bifunctional oligoribonuclease/PAP phosphatase NrnA [Actinomycetota bacterium]